MTDTNRNIRAFVEDKWVGIRPSPGVPHRTIEIPNIETLTPDPDVRVMNWDGAKGLLEFETPSRGNETFTNIIPWEPLIDEWDRLALIEDTPIPMPLDEYKADAKSKLAFYYIRYTNSQFTVGPSTFKADSERMTMNQSINAFVKDDPGNVNYFVVDIFDEPFPINSQATWNTFWAAYKQLYIDARTNMTGVWPAIQAATTEAEVDAALATLPPIPGSV